MLLNNALNRKAYHFWLLILRLILSDVVKNWEFGASKKTKPRSLPYGLCKEPSLTEIDCSLWTCNGVNNKLLGFSLRIWAFFKIEFLVTDGHRYLLRFRQRQLISKWKYFWCHVKSVSKGNNFEQHQFQVINIWVVNTIFHWLKFGNGQTR